MTKQNSSGATVNNQAIFNIIGTVVLTGINFLTVPIFTRVLGPENFGYFAVFSSWIMVITCFIDLTCRQGLLTAKYHFPDEYESYRSGSLLMGTCSAGSLTLLGLIFIIPLSRFLGYPSWLTILLILISYAYSVVEFARISWIYEKKAKLNFIISITLSAATVGLSLLLIPQFSGETLYYGRVLGYCLPYIAAAIFLWLYIFRKKPVGYNKVHWKYAFTIGLPIVFHTLSHTVLSQSNRIMMERMGVSDENVGIYSFFFQLTAFVTTLLMALNTSWAPFYFDDLNNRDFGAIKKKCRNYMELFTVVVCGFLLVCREVIPIFADERFFSGINIIPLLILAIFFTFMYQFPVNFEMFHKKTNTVAIGTISAAVFNILLNLIFIGKWGMYGAAFATVLSYIALFLAHYTIARNMKVMVFHVHIKDFAVWIGIVLIACGLFYLLAPYAMIRWLMGVALGGYIVYKVYKRRSIF